MTHRRFQNPSQGYDRRDAEREAQSAVEADMLFEDAQTEAGLESLMGDAPAEARAPKTAGPTWDLPQELGKVSGDETVADAGSQAAEPTLESAELESLAPAPMDTAPMDDGLEDPAALDAPTEAAVGEPEAAADEKITTVMRRLERTRPPSKRQQQKKKGFLKRFFGG